MCVLGAERARHGWLALTVWWSWWILMPPLYLPGWPHTLLVGSSCTGAGQVLSSIKGVAAALMLRNKP